MFLRNPRHEILAQTGSEVLYTGRLFYDLCAYRDDPTQKISLPTRKFFAQVGFAALAVASLIEAAVLFPILLIKRIFSEDSSEWFKRVEATYSTPLYTAAATVCNLFVSHVIPEMVLFEQRMTYFSQNELLFHACEVGELAIARALIEEEGASPHKVDPKTQVSPAIIPTLVGHAEMQDLFSLNSYEKGYLELKQLSHWLGLKGVVKHEGHPLDLEGAQGHWLFASLEESFQRFRTWGGFDSLALSQAAADTLQQALSAAYHTHNYQTIAENIREGELTFTDAGWKNHALSIAFYGNYLAIGNTGVSSLPTLMVYKIDAKRVRAATIEEILTYQGLSAQEGKRYFYHELPRKLSESGSIERDRICKQFRTIGPKHQKVGNCALASKKATLRFAWTLLTDPSPTLQTMQRARKEAKLYTNLTAALFLDEADLYKKYPELRDLANRAYAKGQKKILRARRLSVSLRHIPGLLRSFTG